jgi:hypothetical protein
MALWFTLSNYEDGNLATMLPILSREGATLVTPVVPFQQLQHRQTLPYLSPDCPLFSMSTPSQSVPFESN